MEKKNIILVGKAASGKDYFKDYLIKRGFKTSTSHTTRPMRDGETNGKTYHFTSKFIFKVKAFFGYFFEYKEFNGWLYGTSKKEMKKGEVFIFTPGGVKDLPQEFLDNSIVVFFDIRENIRKIRLEKRSDSDQVWRRLLADEKDFKNFHQWNKRIVKPFFSCESLLNEINYER